MEEKENNVSNGAKDTESRDGKSTVQDQVERQHGPLARRGTNEQTEEKKDADQPGRGEPMPNLKKQTRVSMMGNDIVEQYNGIKCLMEECRRLANLVGELKQEQRDADKKVQEAHLERDQALEKVEKIESGTGRQHVEHLDRGAHELSQKLENLKENYTGFEMNMQAEIEHLENDSFVTPHTGVKGQHKARSNQEKLKDRMPLQETTNRDMTHPRAGICMTDEKQITWASMRDAMRALQDENELLLSKVEEKTQECTLLVEENRDYSEQVRALADAQDYSKALVLENKELFQQVQGLTSQLSASLTEDDTLKRELILVKQALASTTAEKRTLEDEFEELKASIGSLIEQRKLSEGMFESMIHNFQIAKAEEVNTLRSQLQCAEERCASIQEELATALAESGMDQERIWELEKELSDSRQKIDMLTLELQGMEDEQAAKSQAAAQKDMGFSACTAAWEKLLNEKDKDITALNGTVLELEAKNEDLLNELEEAYAFIEGLEESDQEVHNNLTARLQALESESFSLSDELFSARGRVCELEREVVRLGGCEDRAAFLAEQHLFLQEQLEDEIKSSHMMEKRIESLHKVSWFLHSKLEEKDSHIKALENEYKEGTGKLGEFHGELVRELSVVAESAKTLQVELRVAQSRIQQLEGDSSTPSDFQEPPSGHPSPAPNPLQGMLLELVQISDELTIRVRAVVNRGKESEEHKEEAALKVSNLLYLLRKLAERMQACLLQQKDCSEHVGNGNDKMVAVGEHTVANTELVPQLHTLQKSTDVPTSTASTERGDRSIMADKNSAGAEVTTVLEEHERNITDLRVQLAERDETIQQLQECITALKSINSATACIVSEMQEKNRRLGNEFNQCHLQKLKLERENFILKSITFGISHSHHQPDSPWQPNASTTGQELWAGMYAEENERLLCSLEQASV